MNSPTSPLTLRTLAAIVATYTLGCGSGSPERPAPNPVTLESASDRLAAAAVAAPSGTLRTTCTDNIALWAAVQGSTPVGLSSRNTELRVFDEAGPRSARVRARLETPVGVIRAYVDRAALGMIVQREALLRGTPLVLAPGARVCVRETGELPEEVPTEATLALTSDWVFSHLAPARVDGRDHTWVGRVARDALGPRRPARGEGSTGEPPSSSRRFDAGVVELLTANGEPLARAESPRETFRVVEERGGIMAIEITESWGHVRLRAWTRAPSTELASLSGSSFGLSDLGFNGSGRGTLPAGAAPLRSVGPERPLHALRPGARLRLFTGQVVALDGTYFARIFHAAEDYIRALVSIGDGVFLLGRVDADDVADLILAAESVEGGDP